jgi:hypothetical protein
MWLLHTDNQVCRAPGASSIIYRGLSVPAVLTAAVFVCVCVSCWFIFFVALPCHFAQVWHPYVAWAQTCWRRGASG